MLKSLTTAVVLTVGVSITTRAEKLPPNAIPLNVPGTYTLPAPPPNFDPEKASPDELQTYGLPPMPDKTANPKQHTNWLNAVSMPNRIVPVLEKTNLFHMPHHAAPPTLSRSEQRTVDGAGSNATAIGSYNWSGYAIYNPSGPFGTEAVVGSYVVPVARNPFGQCPNSPLNEWRYSSYWVGIDGLANDALFQSGVDADSYNNCAEAYQNYVTWIEWIPGPEIQITNLPVTAGDYIFIQNWTTHPTTGCFFWANESQQWSASVCSSAGALGGNPITGSSVEWVSERPYTGEGSLGFAPLTNYVTVPWWQSYAWNYAASSPTYNYPGYAPSGTAYLVYAVDDNGTLISYPFLTGTDSTFFYDYNTAYCTPGATCTPRY
jgi:Peptidase A4 family